MQDVGQSMKAATKVMLVCVAGIVGYFLGARREPSNVPPRVEPSRPSFELGSSTKSQKLIPVEESLPDVPVVGPPQVAKVSPDSVMRFELESMKRGDVSAVARSIVLSPEARAVIESAFASVPSNLTREYPTPELLAAFVFCGAQRIEGFRIKSTTYEGPDRALQRVDFKFESEEDWRSEELMFLLQSDGWRRVVDLGVAQRVAVIIGIQKK